MYEESNDTEIGGTDAWVRHGRHVRGDVVRMARRTVDPRGPDRFRRMGGLQVRAARRGRGRRPDPGGARRARRDQRRAVRGAQEDPGGRAMRRIPGFLALAIVPLLVGTACSGGGGSQTATGGVRVGSVAPDFSLPSTSGDTVSLSEFRGRKAVLLYFSMGPG